MSLKVKLLKALIIILGFFCLYAFLAVRIPFLYNLVLKERVYPNYWDKTKYGELYYFSHINHFKEENIPPAQTKFQYKPTHSSVNDCDILTFGDSYFDFSRNKQFPERLHDDFDLKVHFYKGDNILSYLESNNYDTTVQRVLLYERTERWIPLILSNKDNLYSQSSSQEEEKQGIVTRIKDFIFLDNGEKLYDAMLRRSYPTEKIYSAIATVKFDLFKYISKYTPKYYLNDTIPWLFYYDQVNEEPSSFYYKHSEEEMDSICNNIVYLSNILKEKYNIRFVFLPLPAKYTLYHDIINDDEYNNFMQRLYERLDKANILYVDVFNDFARSDELVFYGTDDHWREAGVKIAYNKTIKVLKNDSITSHLLFNEN